MTTMVWLTAMFNIANATLQLYVNMYYVYSFSVAMLEIIVYKHSSRDLSDSDGYAIYRRLLPR